MSDVHNVTQLGRPSKLNLGIILKAQEYIGGAYKEPPCNDVIPLKQGLSCYLGIAESTIYDWQQKGLKELNENKELIESGDYQPSLFAIFSETTSTLSTMQAKSLINGGLAGAYNPQITKLMLAVNHGMHDKTDNTLSAPGGETFVFGVRVIDDSPVSHE